MNMRRLKKIIILVIVAVLAGIVIFKAADKSDDKKEMTATLYFLNSDGSTVIGYQRNFDSANDNQLYKDVAESLVKGPSNKKYTAIMDKDVKINRLNNSDGKITIDFSKEYRDAGILSAYAVIKTFCQLPGIESCLVTCMGTDVLGSGFIRGEEINLESDDDCATTVKIYFLDEAKGKLGGEYRKISITDTQPIEQYILSELIKGPKAEKNKRLLSEDMTVLSAETTDGTCYVNFAKGFTDKNMSEDMKRLVIYSVVNSLTQREGIENVQFLIDGKKAEKFGDTDISLPLYRDENLIG